MKPTAAPGSGAGACCWAMNEISSWSTISSGRTRSVGLAVPLEQLRILDPDVAARGVDQVGQPAESAERHRPLQPEVRADEFDRFVVPDRRGIGQSSQTMRRILRSWFSRGRRWLGRLLLRGLGDLLRPALDRDRIDRSIGTQDALGRHPVADRDVGQGRRVLALVLVRRLVIDMDDRRRTVAMLDRDRVGGLGRDLARDSGSETRTVIAVNVSPLTVPWAATLTPTLTSAFDPGALPSVDGRVGDGDDPRLAALALDGDARRADRRDLATRVRRRDGDRVDRVRAVGVAGLAEADPSPTCRSPTAIGWPPLVMTVSGVTAIVRLQPSSVASETCDPLIARIVIGPRGEPMPLSRPMPLPLPVAVVALEDLVLLRTLHLGRRLGRGLGAGGDVGACGR